MGHPALSCRDAYRPLYRTAPPSLSSREPVTFRSFVFKRTPDKAVILSEALADLSQTKALWRGVEGPRRYLLADALQDFPAAIYKGSKKSQALSEAEGRAVHRVPDTL
jgi:hypothetical protein